MLQPSSSIESRSSWIVAVVCVFVVGTAFGAPWLVTVALKQIAAEMGGARSVPSAAVAFAWFGAACGGIAMGRIAERVGVRYTVLFGSAMIAFGLFVASRGEVWQLYLGYGLFVGIIGIGGIIIATLLTLFFLPALYVAWYRIHEPDDATPPAQTPQEA